jgi:hypothetical protein
VKSQVLGGNQRGGEDKRIADEMKAKEEKKKEQEQKALIQSLFKSVSLIQQQTVKEGEDPKSILCAYFKQGVCEKGKKCKFSHDLAIEGKSAKIDIYTDPRDRSGKPEWRTDIICQHFLDAVEKNLYGWLWECPNGGDKCIYTHALPQGYVLQREKKELEKALLKGDDDDDELTLEEKIEEERAALPSEGLTPVTLESFQAWKVRKAERKQKELEEKLKEEAKKQGTNTKGVHGVLSGRALFKFDPNLFQDDEAAADSAVYEERNEEEEEEQKQQEGKAEEEEEKTAEVDEDLFKGGEDGQAEEEPDFD